MQLKQKLMVTVCIFGLGIANQAMAQTTTNNDAEETVKTRTISVDANKVEDVYKGKTGVDSGVSVIKGEAVQDNARSSGDANEILRLLPSVQFNNNRYSGSKDALQDIHPLDFSISGGKYYENNITIDGIGVNTRLDTTETNAAAINEVAGSRAQTQWINTNLIDNIEVIDSDVSAEYGSFTGGVVNVKTRKPLGLYSVAVNTSCVNDGLTSFKVGDKTRQKIGTGTLVAEPEYQRCNLGATIDFPTIAGTNFLFSVDKQFSEVTYFKDANYGGGQYKQSSVNDNYILKANRDFGTLFALEAQIVHSPYSSERELGNQQNNVIVTHGGGDRALLGIKSLETPILGSKEWEFNVSYSDDDTSRQAAPDSYTWPSTLPGFNVCGSANCNFGGFGDIDQNEKEISLNTKFAWDVFYGKLKLGAGYEKVDATKVRPEPGFGFSTAVTGTNIVCATAEDACINGQAAFTRRQTYLAYDIDVSLETANIWGEWNAKFGDLSLRLGARADYDSFLENTDIAPRFTASYDLGRFEIFGGANRYYSKSFLSYAIREKMPDTYRYDRVAKNGTGGTRIYSEADWAIAFHSKAGSYANADLKTPYVDEFTVGINGDLGFGINSRLKYIKRDEKDTIVGGRSVVVSFINEATNRPATYTVVMPSNDGHSAYEGVRLELFKKLGKNHTLSFNAAWADKNSYGNTYFDDIFKYENVYYNGKILPYADVLNLTEQANYHTPTIANIGLNSRWFDGRFKTSVSARWKDGYNTIVDSESTIRVSNVSYRLYEDAKFKSATEIDLKLDYQLISEGRNKVNVTADITNLLDKVQYPLARTASNPYEKGRTIWLGINYKY